MSGEQAQQLMQQMQALEAYFADLSQREAAFQGVLREAVAAAESIRELGRREADALVPVGMGAYVPTRVPQGSKVVVSVGAGVSVEKDFKDAADYMEARIKEAEVALQDNAARRQDAAARLEQGREQMNRMMQQSRQQGAGSGNV